MAKKVKKITHKRRKSGGRKMSGVGGHATVALAIVGGAVLGKLASKQLSGKINDKILSAGLIGAGFFLPRMVKGDFGSGLGAGLIAAGGTGLVSSFGILNGMGALEDEYQMEMISGDEVPTVGEVETIGSGEEEETVYLNGTGTRLPGDFPVLCGIPPANENCFIGL